MSALPRWVVSLCSIVSLAGCYHDKTSATGDEGRIVYSLITDYSVPENDLRQARIVTGHEQTLQLELTDRGRHDISHPSDLTHRLTPSQGTTVQTHGGDDESSSLSVDIEVEEPGTYTLESMLGDEVMDRVDLQFERPAGFEMIVKVRGPWDGSFDKVGGDPITVEEGTQLILQPVPVDAGGDRLAGDMTTYVGVDPKWAVTPGQDVLFNTEYSMWTFRGEINFYFIEPGQVTFTIEDPATDARTDQRFDVTPVVH
jgi:hypothetical protein